MPESMSPERKRLNVKALLVLLLAVPALAGAVHLVHGFQVKRNALAVREQADQAEREGQLDRAAEYLGTYLGLEPADTDALARYGALLAKQAKTPAARRRAALLLETVLIRDPGRLDVRRQLASLTIDLGRFSEAKQHVDALRAGGADDAEVQLLAARCERGLRQLDRAAEWYAGATAADPRQVEWFVELANLQRRGLNKPEQADQTIRRLLAENPHSARARLAAARYFHDAGAQPQARDEINLLTGELAGQLPDLPEKGAEVSLLAAEVSLALGNGEEARRRLEDGLKRSPDDTRLERRLAALELGDGRPEKARELLRRSVQSLPEQSAELWALGNILLDLGDRDQAQRVIEAMPGKESSPFAAHLRARLLMKEQAWGDARTRLEKAAPDPRAMPQLVREVSLLLAECYERLGNPDQRLRACRRAAEADPQSPAARRALAVCLAAAGRLDQAIEEYDKITLPTPEFREERARLLLLRNLRLPADERRWDELGRFLKERQKELADHKEHSVSVQLLQAEYLAAVGKPAEAQALMEKECERDPKETEPWLLLAGLAERQGRPEAVLPLLDTAEQKAGRRVEWQVARARYWAKAKAPQAAERLRAIESSLEQFPADEQGRLAMELAGAFVAAGDPAAAERLWGRVAQREPSHLLVRYLLFDRAREGGREADMERLLGEMRRIEGPGGALSSCAAAERIIARKRPDDREAIAAARRHLAAAAAERPSWSRVPLEEAALFELEGRADSAAEKYREAIAAGERRLPVVRRALALLTERGRYAEAAALLRGLPDEAAGSPLLAPLASRVSLLTSDADDGSSPAAGRRRALELARVAAAATPTDYRAQLWLGHVARLANEPEQAREAFRKARDLADGIPETWVALVLFLADSDPKQAEAETEAARRRLPPEKLPLALAPCYEALKRPADAEAQFEAALAARPGDAEALRGFAAYYLRHKQPAPAAPLLRRLLDPKTKAPEAVAAGARRDLALLLARSGDYQQFREALALIDENLKAGGTVFDRQWKGLVLSAWPAHRREAIALLEETSAGPARPPDEVLFALAQLHEAEGNWPKALARMAALLRGHAQDPAYLAYYVRALLNHGDTGAAATWLARLEKVSAAPETMELKARLLRAQGQDAKAVRLLTDREKEAGAPLGLIARLLDEFGERAEAEKAYRAAASADPAAALPLALHLAAHRRLPEALALCESAWQTCPPEAVARAGMTAIDLGDGDAEQCRRVAAWLTTAIDRHPDKALRLTELLAMFREQHGEPAEAEALYRKVLRSEKRNPVALNNLALLLALRGGHDDEALELAGAALDSGGPRPEFLDTRAVVYLKRNQPELALKDAERAVQAKATAVRCFHLAQAQHRTGARAEAAASLSRAWLMGLKEGAVHPLERPTYLAALKELTDARR